MGDLNTDTRISQSHLPYITLPGFETTCVFMNIYYIYNRVLVIYMLEDDILIYF